MNEELIKIATAIDTAADIGDVLSIKKSLDHCSSLIDSECSSNRAILLFFIANCYSALAKKQSEEIDDTWSWSQEYKVSEILNLRKSILEEEFSSLDIVLQCKILTNMGNILSQLGRTVESTKYYNQALKLIPNFAMALGNKGVGLFHYAQHLYDYGHSGVVNYFANIELQKAIKPETIWDSGLREEVLEYFSDHMSNTSDILNYIEYDKTADLNRWSLGDSQEELSYRNWCLNNELFLNPLNDACKLSVAATDSIHLPSHSYNIDDAPRFPNYFNILKQEYVSARFMHFEASKKETYHFSDKDVLLMNGFDGSRFSYRTEQLKISFRITYSLFDKIALFLNDYMNVGIKSSGVNFRTIWGKFENKRLNLYPCFENCENWPLRGLYYLSKDLFDPRFTDIALPDAKELSELRNRAEHRFLSVQEYNALVMNTENQRYIEFEHLESKSLKLLSMAREALIYLSLAMHQEESNREKSREDSKIFVPIQSVPFESDS